MGGWAIAQSPYPGTTISVERLKRKGYIAMMEYYQMQRGQVNEPLGTASPDYFGKTRTPGALPSASLWQTMGVRPAGKAGAHWRSNGRQPSTRLASGHSVSRM